MALRLDRALLLTCLIAAVLFLPSTQGAEPVVPIRALVLVGDAPPGVRSTALNLARILRETGRFDARLDESPAGLSSRTLEGFRIVIDAGSGLAAGGEEDLAIARFVASGRGLVSTHDALASGTALSTWPVTVGRVEAPPVEFLDATILRPDHPIVTGLQADFRVADSIPKGLAPRPESEVIVAVKGPDGESPALVASRSSEGRIVALALGSDRSSLRERAVETMFARACEWAATGTVAPPSKPERGPIRALVMTGVHDHDAAFYSLFTDNPDLAELPVDTAANAFKRDLRDRYDVAIFYDFSRDLDETGRKNLRSFVETGKGVVVLHHALLDFQTWGWWSEEVVGGRYRLQPEGKAPSSGVKDDQSIFATPAGSHPILEGITPFHIVDEAYNKLFMSDRIKPLLTTDNPTSDPTLAWVGPGKDYRVVAIQLGHGKSAFDHPSYRALVRNAIRWAADR